MEEVVQKYLYEYSFLKTDKNRFSDLKKETQDKIRQSKSIHLYQINDIAFDFQGEDTDLDIFVYTFSSKSLDDTLNNGYIPHFCFKGEDIYNEEKQHLLTNVLEIDNNLEVFWFPDDKTTTIEIEPFLDIVKTLEKLNTPICVSFSEIFNNKLNHSRYHFLKTLLSCFKNPLLLKEQTLLSEESFSNGNLYMEDLDEFKSSNIVLGLFGDEVISNDGNVTELSAQYLRKNKSCLMCENFEYCANRGLGFISEKYQIKDCIGISLFQNK